MLASQYQCKLNPKCSFYCVFCLKTPSVHQPTRFVVPNYFSTWTRRAMFSYLSVRITGGSFPSHNPAYQYQNYFMFHPPSTRITVQVSIIHSKVFSRISWTIVQLFPETDLVYVPLNSISGPLQLRQYFAWYLRWPIFCKKFLNLSRSYSKVEVFRWST